MFGVMARMPVGSSGNASLKEARAACSVVLHPVHMRAVDASCFSRDALDSGLAAFGNHSFIEYEASIFICLGDENYFANCWRSARSYDLMMLELNSRCEERPQREYILWAAGFDNLDKGPLACRYVGTWRLGRRYPGYEP